MHFLPYLTIVNIALIVVLGCSLATIAILITKLLEVKSYGNFHKDTISRVEELLKGKDKKGAKEICLGKKDFLSQLILEALSQSHEDKEELKNILNAFGQIKIFKLEKGVSLLSLLSRIVPILGLLFIVCNFMATLQEIKRAQFGSVPILSMSNLLESSFLIIALAIVTSIIAMIAYHILREKIVEVVNSTQVQINKITPCLTVKQYNDKLKD